MLVIRDHFDTIHGGGKAIAHDEACGQMPSLAEARTALSGTSADVSEYRYRVHPEDGGLNDIDDAIREFRRMWSVPVDVRWCDCLG